MRTTVDINDEIMRRIKRIAADEKVSLKQIIERALRELVSRRRPGRQAYRVRWRSEHGRLQPGVKIEDRDALFDLMDGRR